MGEDGGSLFSNFWRLALVFVRMRSDRRTLPSARPRMSVHTATYSQSQVSVFGVALDQGVLRFIRGFLFF